MADHRLEGAESSLPTVTDVNDPAAGDVPNHPLDLRDNPGLRHLGGAQVRLRRRADFTETMHDYLDIFRELQIDAKYHDVFWTDVIYRYRQGSRHGPLLKRGTEVSIKSMTDDMLRAYGERIWGIESGWRCQLAEAEDMLVYAKDQGNARLREIFDNLWWRMRGLVYEEKPPTKRHANDRSGTASGGRKKQKLGEDVLSDEDGAYTAGIQDHSLHGTGSGDDKSLASSRLARAKATKKLNKIADRLPSPGEDRFLTFEQTEEGIMDIVIRIHNLRLASNHELFDRLWAAHVGRAEEFEASLSPCATVPVGQDAEQAENPSPNAAGAKSGENGSGFNLAKGLESDVSELVTPAPNAHTPAAAHQAGQAASSDAAAGTLHSPLVARQKRGYPNLSSEPFNSSGSPTPQTLVQKHILPPTLPAVMSIWITTYPPHGSFQHRAYHHPAAPVRAQDVESFFHHVISRADNIEDGDVQGYALSYGWCDVSRWIDKTVQPNCRGDVEQDGTRAGSSTGERLGWEVFQRDLVDAADAGVMVWRMKVLVVKK